MYKVSFSRGFEKGLKKIPPQMAYRIICKAEELGNNPFPAGYKKLEGTENGYRIRIGKYRVLYEVYNDEVLIIVFSVGHRKDVYR